MTYCVWTISNAYSFTGKRPAGKTIKKTGQGRDQHQAGMEIYAV